MTPGFDRFEAAFASCREFVSSSRDSCLTARTILSGIQSPRQSRRQRLQPT